MHRRLDRLEANLVDRAATALRIEAELIMTDSKENYVPVDSDALRGSGHVEKVVRWGRLLSVSMVYGNTSVTYATAVHEHPSEFSPVSWGDKVINFTRGGPKYLEKPMNKALPFLADRMAARLQLRTMI